MPSPLLPVSTRTRSAAAAHRPLSTTSDPHMCPTNCPACRLVTGVWRGLAGIGFTGPPACCATVTTTTVTTTSSDGSMSTKEKTSPTPMNLDGPYAGLTVLVTGSSRGLGLEFVKQLGA